MDVKKVGRPTVLSHEVNVFELSTKIADSILLVDEITNTLDKTIGKSPQETRKARTIQRKLNQLKKMVDGLQTN